MLSLKIDKLLDQFGLYSVEVSCAFLSRDYIHHDNNLSAYINLMIDGLIMHINGEF